MSSSHNSVYYHPCYRENELEYTPSRQKIDLARELKLRAFMCSVIYRAARKLQLPQMSVATACFYLHNFYMKRSMLDLDRVDVAAACLFVACKAEECRRGIYKIMKAFLLISKKGKDIPGPKTENAKKLCHRILALEIEVLNTIDYCFQVPHPYPFLTPAITTLVGKDFAVSEKEQFGALNQLAWCFATDSVKTPVSLFYPPQQIALACVDLAFRYYRLAAEGRGGTAFRFSKGWFSQFDPELKAPVLQSICCHILDVFEQKSRPIDAKHLRGLDISEGPPAPAPEVSASSPTSAPQQQNTSPPAAAASSTSSSIPSAHATAAAAVSGSTLGSIPATTPAVPHDHATNQGVPSGGAPYAPHAQHQQPSSNTPATSALQGALSDLSLAPMLDDSARPNTNGAPYIEHHDGQAGSTRTLKEVNGADQYSDATSTNQQSSHGASSGAMEYGSHQDERNGENFGLGPRYETSVGNAPSGPRYETGTPGDNAHTAGGDAFRSMRDDVSGRQEDAAMVGAPLDRETSSATVRGDESSATHVDTNMDERGAPY